MIIPRTIYAIQHNVTKKIYIGSSKNAYERFKNHICRLRNGKHPVEDMQMDFDEYGENFSLIILEKITSYEEKNHEYYWMEKYKSNIKGIGYNYKDHCRNLFQNESHESD